MRTNDFDKSVFRSDEAESGVSEAQRLFWNQLVLVRVVANCVRHYRDDQAWWLNRLGLFKVVVTSTTIAAWGLWRDLAFVWAVLLGAAQVLDAAKDYLPRGKQIHAISECLCVLEALFIDARFEWYSIGEGKYSNPDILEKWRDLAKLLAETERKYFPQGLSVSPRVKRLAEEEAVEYIRGVFTGGGTARA